ncbi:MAG: carbohydrate ABC transporter permease [Candidatus Sumerlaeia bacterium]|nr:carbohydrate ABC transporter permease [Candidatus Sumerlaeia bacterium]
MDPTIIFRTVVYGLFVVNVLVVAFILFGHLFARGEAHSDTLESSIGLWAKRMRRFLVYEALVLSSFFMVVPFYWMVSTSFKDARTAIEFPPEWLPVRIDNLAPPADQLEPGSGSDLIRVKSIGFRRRVEDPIRVVPQSEVEFRAIEVEGATIHREVWDTTKEYLVPPDRIKEKRSWNFSIKNFLEAWYAPEEATRGQANFTRYFFVSIVTAIAATIGTLITGAFAAFAFSRFEFVGKGIFFYIILATMMVPGQVLLIPNFLILSGLGWLDTYAALIVPWLASVFTIFLMRQFFLTIPVDLWEAARIDGASSFRYLVQIVVPLSKPVFITAGIFTFLNNWNSLLWPLIVTTRPDMRTLMVGLQAFSEDAGTNFHLLMTAATMAILPVVILFFFLQRFFIEGIARTGLK